MEDVLNFLQKYEIWGYAILGVISIIYIQRSVLAWEDFRNAVYGLEKETAQRKLSAALTILAILILIGFAEFVLVSFVAPSYPWSGTLATPTMDLIATPTETLPPIEETPGLLIEGTPEPDTMGAGCAPGQIEFTFPLSGDEIQDTIELRGTVNVPDFGFYKYEYSQPGSDSWLTIAAGDQQKNDEILGTWNTDLITPGSYLLRLVVVTSNNNTLPPCTIEIVVSAP